MPKGIYKRKIKPIPPNQTGKHWKLSEETKKKMSKAKKGIKLPQGIKRTEKTKRKLSEIRRRKWQNPEYRLKMKEILKEKAGRYKRTPETRKKMGEAKRGEKCYFWKGGISTYERKLFLNARRRARIRGAIGSFTFGEWELLKKQYGYCCPCCSKCEPEIKLEIDHIIPLSKGGSNYIENIQPLCGSCNSKKHDKMIKQMIKKILLKIKRWIYYLSFGRIFIR